MSAINSYSGVVAQGGGFTCAVLCALGCGIAGGGCAALCIADGPAPFADAAASGAIATAAGGGAAASTAIAYNI
ncbi:MAG: hypothetical protein WCD89_27445 [Anaerocolumna sp.]